MLFWQLHTSPKIYIHLFGRSCAAATYWKKQHWERTVNLYAPSLHFTHYFVGLCHISPLLRSPGFQVEALRSTQLLAVRKPFIPHALSCCPSLLGWAELLTARSSFRQRQAEQPLLFLFPFVLRPNIWLAFSALLNTGMPFSQGDWSLVRDHGKDANILHVRLEPGIPVCIITSAYTKLNTSSFTAHSVVPHPSAILHRQQSHQLPRVRKYITIFFFPCIFKRYFYATFLVFFPSLLSIPLSPTSCAS